MTTISLAAEFAHLTLRDEASDNDVRTLRDLELALVGGGENTPIWGTTPTPPTP